VVRRLVGWADVVAESYSPGTMEKWGLGYENLKEIKPDVIMLRSSSQGQDGPHSNFSAFGIPLVGLAGFAHLTGWSDHGCLPLPSAYSDLVSPRFAAAALIAALDYRSRTGKGQCVDCSQLEASIHFLTPVMLDYAFNGRQAGRLGNSCPYACPHGAYRCKGDDRWCAISVYNDEEWRSLCRICGSDWDQDPRFRTLLDRKRNEDELNRLVEDWTVNFTAEEVEGRMQAGGIAAGVVRNARDLCLDQNLRDEDYLWSLKHPVLGSFPHMGQPARMSKTPAQAMLPAPCLGEHTEYVCTQLLGMTDDEFLDLYQTGIFG
jgi:benzylsuccinate CoA-transferase BbsF subunit